MSTPKPLTAEQQLANDAKYAAQLALEIERLNNFKRDHLEHQALQRQSSLARSVATPIVGAGVERKASLDVRVPAAPVIPPSPPVRAPLQPDVVVRAPAKVAVTPPLQRQTSNTEAGAVADISASSSTERKADFERDKAEAALDRQNKLEALRRGAELERLRAPAQPRHLPSDEVDAAPFPSLGLGGSIGAGAITGPKRATERKIIAESTAEDEKFAKELEKTLNGVRSEADIKANEDAARQLQATLDAKDAAELAAKRAEVERKALEENFKLVDGEDNKQAAENKKALDVASLAVQRILAEDRAKASAERKAREEQSASDAVAALMFSDFSQASVQFRPDSVSPEKWKEMRAELQTILNSPTVIGEKNAKGALTDAHKFTTTLIRAGIPVLLEIDKACTFSSETMSPAKVQAEIQAFLKNVEVQPGVFLAHINNTFLKIGTARNPVDAETGANVYHILSRTWTLAKNRKLGPTYQRKVASILSDNIADQGGCIAGLIARLYPLYAQMIGERLGMTAPKPAEAPKAIAVPAKAAVAALPKAEAKAQPKAPAKR